LPIIKKSKKKILGWIIKYAYWRRIYCL
jgi:hypothetical protein